MKSILTICAWLLIPAGLLYGQSRSSATSIGFIGAQQQVDLPNHPSYFVVSGGNVITTPSRSVGPDGSNVTAGLAYPVSYFNQVFDTDLFISKGYNPDVVRMQWNILSSVDRIERFLIYRKPLGTDVDSTLVASLSADTYAFNDEFVQQGTVYKYTIFAQGIADSFRIPFINVIEGTGFAFPSGAVSGRVTFEGGTAVEGVTVVAETDGDLQGKSILLDGVDDFLEVPHSSNDDELQLSRGFSIQMWTRFEGEVGTKGTLFSKGPLTLTYDGNALTFDVVGMVLNMPYQNPVDSFFHVSAVYDPDLGELRLTAATLDINQQSQSITIGSSLADDFSFIRFGRDDLGNFYKGYIDEIRLWNRPLGQEEITDDFIRYLAGLEEGLVGYWQLDAGVTNEFYDFSQPESGSFYENHGELVGAEFQTLVPLKSQLAFKGVTDENGNYTITGFPFESEGSLYRFTPILGIHKFDPTEQIRFVGPSEAIHNEVDFLDISSFPVSGTVRYENTNFPVEGVSIQIDGQPALDGEGNLILTDNLGQFTVDVPIGLHTIRMSKSQHTFVKEGRFPERNEGGEIIQFDFQEPLAGLEFLDNTLVKFAGRVVGGPREKAKALGFGLSKDNIGDATIDIGSEKGFVLALSEGDSIVNSDEPRINSTTTFNGSTLSIEADPATGEFVAYLPPEKYFVADVRSSQYTFDETYNISFDLTSFFEEEDTREDTLKIEVNGTPVEGFPPFDPNDYKAVVERFSGDSLYTLGLDTFRYEARRDFILRVSPTLDVVNEEDGDLFGETSYTYTDDIQEVEVPLIENGSYTFGYPVFRQGSRYLMKISAFEEYVNDENEADRVPVSDGTVEIVNDLAKDRETTLSLDSRGRANYLFIGGFPSLSMDPINPENSFTKVLSINSVTGEQANIRTAWQTDQPFRGYLFGGLAQGNDFVTNGPTQMVTILRDPPGSNSFAFLEKGQTIEKSEAWEVGKSDALDRDVTADLGASTTTFVGLGAGIIEEIAIINDLSVGVSLESSYSETGEQSIAMTSTKTWTTDELFPFVSAPGDIFVGYATNLVYGVALSLQPLPVSSVECLGDDCGIVESNGFKLGTRVGLRVNPEFGTTFIYSQLFIEDELLPELTDFRNGFLTYSPTPDDVVPQGDNLVYLSLVPPSDPNFGKSNADKEAWGNAATSEVGNGPSYRILVPEGFDPEKVYDTVDYYNNQINDWIYWLRENERQKVQAALEENISIDGGAQFDQTMTIEESETTSRSFSWSVDASIASEVGFSGIGSIGVKTSLALTTGVNGGESFGSSTVNSTTYGFTIGDDEGVPNNGGTALDYHSIDIKKPQDGFGPVFVLRAGATSCPYEGEQLTKYYEPGQHVLQFASLQTEKVELVIENPTVANIPSNRDAEITVQLINQSESENSLWFRLAINDQANPNGAIIRVDGRELDGEGRSFLVNFGETLIKTVTISKGAGDVFDYEDLGLRLISECNATILDEKSLSVFFQPGCSDISLVTPVDQWVLNTATRPVNTQTITFDSYDLQNETFEFAAFQYKPTSSSTWITNTIFYNPLTIRRSEFDDFDEPKLWLDGSGTTTYDWDMNDLPDRTYDIRIITSCEIGGDVPAITPTAIHTGRKDVSRPQLFGTPQPGDGILSAGDDIRIQFSEEIEAGLLTPFNFSMKGVFNNTPLDHSASVQFDGLDDYVRIEDGLSLGDTDFTIFFWLRREQFGEAYTLFSKGYFPGDVFEVGFTANNQLSVNISGQEILSSQTYPTTGQSPWEYYGITYDSQTSTVSAYRNGLFVLENVPVTSDFSGGGVIDLGRSMGTEEGYFPGNMHELRIWKAELSQGEIVADKDLTLTGSEVGLVGYWPMNEATGELAFDKARFRHARVNADWQVDPQGYSIQFDGVDDYIALNTASTVVVEDDADFTVEFWFNAAAGQKDVVMFSNGLADGYDEFNIPEAAWNIGVNANGDIYVINNGVEIIAEGSSDLVDGDWHHLALSLSRIGNANLFLDGEIAAARAGADFGGLAGARMWLGARVFNIGNISVNSQRHFNGIIDEFRIWNSTRRSAQIELDYNSALVGDEVGLVAYYPFESYAINAGVPVRTSSLDDQFINEFGPNGGTAVAINGPAFTQNTATIKIARAVQSIDFDWVVNGDQIVITPSESFNALIQGTVIDIAIRDVQDLYGNRLSSPISWTAFVDLNQVKWSETDFEVKIPVNEGYQFNVEIINSAGTEQGFTIENLPPWLSVSQSIGTIDPQSAIELTFTINEGLNVGYYDEDIYLSTDLGFREKLQLDVAVEGDTPDWSVNPFDFQYSMNMVAALSISGVESRDVNDLVAAFVDGEIRGVSDLTYIPALDRFIAFLDIYSNDQTGEEVELRVWDASVGFEYRDVEPELTFVSNQVIGQPFEPEVIRAGEVILQALDVQKGWNWLSFNLQSTQLDKVSDLLENLNPERGDHIKSQTAVDIYTDELGWLGTLTSGGGVEVGELYQLLSSNPGTIELKGTRVSPSEIKLSIVEGWNFIGFTPLFNLTVAEAFANFEPSNGDVVKSQFAFAIYYEGPGWVGSLTTLEPDRGYLYLSGKEGELSFPNTTVLNGRTANENIISEWNGQLDRYKYPDNMSVIGQLDDALSIDGQYILGYVGDELRSVAEPISVGDDSYYFLTIYGNQNESPKKSLEESLDKSLYERLNFWLGDPVTGELTSLTMSMTFDAQLVHGTLESPVIFGVEGPPILEQIKVYPNPFRNEGISVELPVLKGEVELSLLTLTGQLLKNVSLPESFEARKFDWQLGSLNPGVYMVAVRNEQQVFVQRVIKQ